MQCESCPAGPDTDLCEPCYAAMQAGRVQHPPPDARRAASIQGPHRFRAVNGQARDAGERWQAVPDVATIAPFVANGFIVRPVFTARSESALGSYGFVVRDESGVLLLTALHVLDEVIRAHSIDCSEDNSFYTGDELAAVIDDVILYDVLASKWMTAELGRANRMLRLPQARLPRQVPYSQCDIAAFVVAPSAHLFPGLLATHPAARGEPVWLLTRADAGGGSRLTPAVVVEETPETFIFRYMSQQPPPERASGAPVLNTTGEVVAIYVGSGALNGRRFGHGHHVASIRRHLTVAGAW